MRTSLIRRFIRQSQGSVVPLLGLALVPIVGAVGAAVDYSRASSVKTTLQAALDSAVLAGAKDGTSNWNTIASNMFNGNPISKNGSTVATPTFAFDGNSTYTGQVTAKVPTSFGILGFATLNVSANSTVAKDSGPDIPAY